jgi:hypothetical protein
MSMRRSAAIMAIRNRRRPAWLPPSTSVIRARSEPRHGEPRRRADRPNLVREIVQRFASRRRRLAPRQPLFLERLALRLEAKRG